MENGNIIVKILRKSGAMTSLRSKPSHVTVRANEKRPHSLLCRIRKYAFGTDLAILNQGQMTRSSPVLAPLSKLRHHTSERTFGSLTCTADLQRNRGSNLELSCQEAMNLQLCHHGLGC
ncbi:hypothetical protein AVEN_70751-1 [Araneus ventricosus]|uniref:Uncharacterized protein n=1 Tax=Araneus ventricosus TaxID=182803 RepID=A0A4Y2B152_ARAVE|nr:hypothetical protein AVEN_70751-1 [Araneus ventricosus]